MTADSVRVHLLKEGRALCGRPGEPGEWPDGEMWVSVIGVNDDALGERLCERCLAANLGKPMPDGLDEQAPHAVVVSDRSGNVTCWCQRCQDTFTFLTPFSITMAGAAMRQFAREHRRCKVTRGGPPR